MKIMAELTTVKGSFVLVHLNKSHFTAVDAIHFITETADS